MSKEKPVVEILGEEFNVSIENGLVTLTHPQWSLSGEGRTIAEAERDLLAMAREVADVLENDPLEILGKDAESLRAYCLRVRGHRVPLGGRDVVGGNP